jgi:hypothetical protein
VHVNMIRPDLPLPFSKAAKLLPPPKKWKKKGGEREREREALFLFAVFVCRA